MKTIVDLTEELKEYSLEKDTAAKQAVEANIAPVEADASSASRAYVVGEQLFLNDVLYDVTSPISVGDAIVVGTNITAANKISADIQTLTNQVDDISEVMGQNGAKNKLVNNLVSGIAYGATLTVNENKSFSFVGTTSGNGSLNICGENNGTEDVLGLPKGEYVLASDSTGLNSNTFLQVIGKDGNGNVTINAIVNSDGKKYTSFTVNEGDFVYWVRLAFPSGAVNVSAKAMICPKAWYDLDPTYQPYAKTNQQLTEDSVTWDDLSEVGAVNYLENKAVNKTSSPVTWTVDTNKIVTATVESNLTATNALDINLSFALSAGAYKLSGCPSGVDDGTKTICRLQLYKSDQTTVVALDNGSGAVFTLASDTVLVCKIRLGSGLASGTYTFYPMIAPASYNGPYVPYAKTNKELTDDVAIKSSEITVNTTNVDSENVTRNYVNRSAGVKVLVLQTKSKIDLLAGTTYELGTVPSDYLPTISTGFVKEAVVNSEGSTALIEVSSGKLKLTPRVNNITTAKSFVVSVTYI